MSDYSSAIRSHKPISRAWYEEKLSCYQRSEIDRIIKIATSPGFLSDGFRLRTFIAKLKAMNRSEKGYALFLLYRKWDQDRVNELKKTIFPPSGPASVMVPGGG